MTETELANAAVDTEFARAALEVTRRWAIEELDAARLRVTNLRCGGNAYNDAIYAINELVRTIDSIAYMLGEKTPTEIMHVAPPADPDGEPVVDMEQPEPEPEPTEPERPIPKLEDVRGQCGEAKKAGVDIKGILNDLGYKNLSSVDSKDYNTLLDKVAAALEEIG